MHVAVRIAGADGCASSALHNPRTTVPKIPISAFISHLSPNPRSISQPLLGSPCIIVSSDQSPYPSFHLVRPHQMETECPSFHPICISATALLVEAIIPETHGTGRYHSQPPPPLLQNSRRLLNHRIESATEIANVETMSQAIIVSPPISFLDVT